MIIDLIKSIDILELFYAFFGAFGGFLLASQWEHHSERRKKKKAIENIALELFGIRMTLCSNIISVANSNSKIDGKAYNKVIYIKYSVLTPVWDSLVNSGVLLDFKDEAYFDELIVAYTRVSMLRAQLISMPNRCEDFTFDKYSNLVKQCIVTQKYIDEFLIIIDFPIDSYIKEYNNKED